MKETDAIQALSALANASRLKVFRALVVAGNEGLTPGALSERLKVPGATMSFHLKELAHAGLVSQERDGRSLIYRANYRRMDALLFYLTENCCQGEPCLAVAKAACDSC